MSRLLVREVQPGLSRSVGGSGQDETMPQKSLASALAAIVACVALAGCSSPAATPDASAPPTSISDSPQSPDATPSAPPIDLDAPLADLEAEYDALVGVSALDTGTGRRVDHRADERFGYASTIKAFLAAQFLHDVPAAERDERVTWTQSDVDAAGYSPVTSEHVADGLTLAELVDASVRFSDNTATNLVFDRLGGPTELDTSLAALGDETTEVVNVEPALNDVEPGGTDDTTTPAAFTADVTTILTSDVLADSDRASWVDLLTGNATGDTLIRAGAPEGWTVADKSGGAGPIRNDVAIVTPPGRDPIVLTILTTKNDPDAAYDDALVADAARVVLDALE